MIDTKKEALHCCKTSFFVYVGVYINLILLMFISQIRVLDT